MSCYVVFDVETPNRYNNRMSAIGITVVENGAVTKEFFSLVNPETHFDYFNIRLTGINEAAVADAPTFPQLWQQIEPIMSSGTLAAHNAPFDMSVLRSCLRDYGIPWKSTVCYACTVQIGRRVLPGMKHNLNVMCDYYGIRLNHHQADSDARAAAEILLRYMRSGVNPEEYVRSYSLY